MWLSSVLLFSSVLMILAGLALMLDAGVHSVKLLRAGARSHRR